MIKPFWVKLTALLLLALSAPSFSLQLFDGKGFLYDIGKDGVLSKGTLDAYAGMYHLRVKGTDYVGDVTRLSPNGRETRREVFVEPGSQLEIRRNLYVSKTQNFARFSEILNNPTDTDVIVDVEIYGKLGSGSNTVAVVDQGNFLTTDDIINEVSGTIPVLLHYHSQVNNTITATHTLIGNQLSWVYSNVEIPKQSQVRLVYFVAQAPDIAAAQKVATFIFSNSTALYEGMWTQVRKELLNFTPAKPIPKDNDAGDFSEAPFLNLGELRPGVLEENDAWSRMRVATPADVYALNLATGETVTIRMSAHFNAYLYLYQDVNGETLLANNDDRGINTTNAEIVFRAPAAQTYYFEATSHNRQERGEYALEIFSGLVNRPPNAYPIEFSKENLTAPAVITFTDFSTDTDGEITERCWQFGDATPIVCDANQTVTHTYQQAGQYSVGLRVLDNSGAYAYRNEQISISSAPVGVVLRVSNTISGELASSDVRSQTRTSAFADHYRISSIPAGKELVIDMTSNDVNSYLYLYDQFNRLLHQDNNSGGEKSARLHYLPSSGGDLLVEATSFHDNRRGKYKLTLELAANSRTVKVPIEALPSLDNPLQYLFIARLPKSFEATFLRWNFGDKSTEVGTDKAVVSHTYSQKKRFTVTVAVLNAENQQLTGKTTFVVNNQSIAPEVRFRASPLFGEKPLRVFFNNESTLNSPDESLSYVWQFGDGEVSTDTNPAHTFTKGGTYHVTLRAFTTRQRASYSIPITVIDRHSAEISIMGKVRELPQVLMAGFDPMLVDLLDTDVKIFAIVRPGKQPLSTVRFVQNDSDFVLVMQHVATYANGDQRYEAVFTFSQGFFAVSSLDNLFGKQAGQFRVQVIDQASQFHAFPNLEIDYYPPVDFIPKSLNIEPLSRPGIRRNQPQVLAAGFDPALVHKSDTALSLTRKSDTEFMVKAIVRKGLFPIQSVTLNQNQGALILPMHLQETLPNGDEMYVVNYTYPSDSLEKGILGNLFGSEPSQFSITVEDIAQQSHSFPQLQIGNFPPR